MDLDQGGTREVNKLVLAGLVNAEVHLVNEVVFISGAVLFLEQVSEHSGLSQINELGLWLGSFILRSH